MNPDNLNHKTASLRVFRALALFLKVFNLILGEVTLSTQFYIHSLHITEIEGIYAGKRRDYTKQIKDNISLNEYICYEEDEIHCEKLYDISDYGEDDQEVPSELSSPPSSSIIGEEMEEEGEGGFGHVAGIESSSSHEDLTPKRSKRRDSISKNPDMKKTESKKNLLNDNLESEIDFNNKGDRNNNKTTKKSKLKKKENLRNGEPGETVPTTSDEPSTRSGKKRKSKSRSPTNLDQEFQEKNGKIGKGDEKDTYQESGKDDFKDRKIGKGDGKETYQHRGKNYFKDRDKEGAKEHREDRIKDSRKDREKEIDTEKRKDIDKERGKDGGKERGEEPTRDAHKKRTKDGGQEKGLKDDGKEGGKQSEKDPGKQSNKESGKQVEKDVGKQSDKERYKQDDKESGKQVEKGGGKQADKERLKEGVKDSEKQADKESLKQSGKKSEMQDFKDSGKKGDKDIGGKSDKDIGKQVDKNIGNIGDKDIEKQGDKDSGKQGDKDIGNQGEKDSGKQADKERLRLPDKESGRQIENEKRRQTEKEKQPDTGRQAYDRGKRGRDDSGRQDENENRRQADKEKLAESARQEDDRRNHGKDDLKHKTYETEKDRGKVTQMAKDGKEKPEENEALPPEVDKPEMLRRKGDTTGVDMKKQQTQPESHKETDAKINESNKTRNASKNKDKESYSKKLENLMMDEDDDDREKKRKKTPTANDKYSERLVTVETEEVIRNKIEKEEEIIEKDRLEIARKQELALIETERKEIEDLKKQHEKINRLERERINDLEKARLSVKQRIPVEVVPDISEQYLGDHESFGDVYQKKPDKYSGPGGMTALLDDTDIEFYEDTSFDIPKIGKEKKGRKGRKKKIKPITKEIQTECNLKMGDFTIDGWNRRKKDRENQKVDEICRNVLCNLESNSKKKKESMEEENTEYAVIKEGNFPGFNDRPIELAIIQTRSSSHRNFLKLFHSAFQCSDRVLVKTTWNNFIVFRYCDGKEKAYYLYNGCTCNINRFRYMDLRGGTAGLIRVTNIHEIIHAIKLFKNPQRKKQKSHEETIQAILSQYASL